MGRHDLRPARVLQTAHNLLSTKRIQSTPPWLTAITDLPPSEVLTRPAFRFAEHKRTRRTKGKPSKMFIPLKLSYPEDKLRATFFDDHPWELARPKIVLEDSGNESREWDWSQMVQPGKKLDGDRFVLFSDTRR
jgi:small subunit ribosomal protein S23